MDDTRVELHKEYRQSFIKEGAIALEDSNDPTTVEISATSSTLPMQEVINAVQEERGKEELIRINRRNRMIKIVLKITLVILVVVGLIVLGYFAWGKNL